MKTINISLDDYKGAKDGSLLIKKGNSWHPISFEELAKAQNDKLKELDELKNEVKVLGESARHFKVYAKSHFMVAFNSLKLKAIVGEIDVDEETLHLDEKVLNDELSVEDALAQNEQLKAIFDAIYLAKDQTLEFQEV